MKCERCESDATVHLVEVTDGKKVELHLCEACAADQGTLEPTIHTPDQGLHILPVPLQTGNKRDEADSPRCPLCDISFQRFRRQGRLGCPACYDAFRPQLLPLLDKIHGAVQHRGKRPGESNPDVLLELKRHQLMSELDKAVTTEAYEEAARLRDEIREIEVQLGLHGAG